MIQAQYYNFVRLGRAGYTAIVENMLANARYLNQELEKTGRFEILNPGLSEPVVTFRLRPDQPFDAFHLSDRLRMNGWIVPAYTLPPNAEDVTVLRAVVRSDMSRDKVDILMMHINEACAYLDQRPPVPTEEDRQTHEHQRRRC
jgi:glutamate decarboxylase